MATLSTPSTRGALLTPTATWASTPPHSETADTFVPKALTTWIPPATSEDVPLGTPLMIGTEFVPSPLYLQAAPLPYSCKEQSVSPTAIQVSTLTKPLESASLALRTAWPAQVP